MKRQLPALYALIAGLAAALAHPPFGLIVGIAAYGAMMLLADGAPNLKSAFWRGWLSGLAYFAVSCWWVFEAFMVDAATFGWMAPFAVALLAGGLGLFWGLAMTAYRALKVSGVLRVLVFAGVFAAFEWVRGHIFTGFPWNLPGTSWEAGGAVSQTAHLVGAYGLTWLTLVLGAAPALLVGHARSRTAWGAVAGAAALLIGLEAYGHFHTGKAPERSRAIAVRVVQPNIPQAAKYDEALYLEIVRKYLTLTTAPPAAGKSVPRLIVWPEGALPNSLNNYLAPGDPVREAIKSSLRPGQTLITGGWRRQGERIFNTMAVVTRTPDDLVVETIYDKHHLVPFGEYVPRFLAAVGLQQLVPLDPFTPGPKPQPIDTSLGRIQPLICYEALFPGYVLDGARLSGRRADMIVNISNDAWFGETSGPWQHHNQARYRAIEEGLPMMRATPTGVSSVIDKYGRIDSHARLGHGRAGAIDSLVYFKQRKDISSLNHVRSMTPFTWGRRWGFLVLLGLSGLSLLACYFRIQKKYVT